VDSDSSMPAVKDEVGGLYYAKLVKQGPASYRHFCRCATQWVDMIVLWTSILFIGHNCSPPTIIDCPAIYVVNMISETQP